MRVLLLSSRLSERGGADRWLLGVAARLFRRVETLLAVGAKDRTLPAAEEARVGPWSRVKGLGRRGGERRGALAAQRGLSALIERFAPDVVQLNDITDPALLGLAAAGGRALIMVQDHRFFCPGRGMVTAAGEPCAGPAGPACAACFDEPAYARQVIALTAARGAALGAMARLLTLSRYMADQLIAQDPALGRSVEVVPPFVDALPPPPATPPADLPPAYHLLAGRLTAHKGVRTALQAALCPKTGLPLVVAGNGPLAPEVEEAAARRPGRVFAVGWVDRAGLARLLAGARTLWLPSRWAEPFGIVGLEALSAGVPVVGSAVGGVPEWLKEGESGLLVPPGDPSALARAAGELAADPELAATLGRQGQTLVARRYAPDRAVERLLELYQEVAGIPGRCPANAAPTERRTKEDRR